MVDIGLYRCPDGFSWVEIGQEQFRLVDKGTDAEGPDGFGRVESIRIKNLRLLTDSFCRNCYRIKFEG